MPIANSLFVASREEAIAYASGRDTDISVLFEFGGMTDLDISFLFAITMDEEFDFDVHEILPVDTDVELFELPDRFLRSLGMLNKERLSRIVTQWSQTEELDLFWEKDTISRVVEALVEIAKAARDKAVYFTQDLSCGSRKSRSRGTR